jgi:hypothetical protein
VQLVASPNRLRRFGHQVEQRAGLRDFAREVARTVDRLGDVRDEAISPTAELIAEDLEPTGRSAADGALADNSSVGAVASSDRRRLDGESSLRDTHFERRVIEVASGAVLESGHHGLVDAAVHPHEVTARAQGEPAEVDSILGRRHGSRLPPDRLTRIGKDADRGCGELRCSVDSVGCR